MPTYGQGAPGVRIRLRDASEVNLVTNPTITAGVVGFSSKGEFNKIIDLASTATQDTVLGSGYNNSKYNQGLYAARAILNSGGFVEFVRPYGEEIITDDQDPDYNTSQKLKTDTFLVQFDYSDAATTSVSIDNFASTRYIQDGFASFGDREIYTIAEAITENTNINFGVDADAQTDAGAGTDKVALFAIMNSDPTAANRAGDRIEIATISGDGAVVTVVTKTATTFVIGDTVEIAGTQIFNTYGTEVALTSVSADGKTLQYAGTVIGVESDGAVFNNTDTVDTGVDYLKVRTVARGMASKKFDYINISGQINQTDDAETLTFVKSDNSEVTIELYDPAVDSEVSSANDAGVEIVYGTFTATASDPVLLVDDGTKFQVGDMVGVRVGVTGSALPTGLTAGADYYVYSVNGNAISLAGADGRITPTSGTTGADNTIINQTAILRGISTALSEVAGLATASSYRVNYSGINDVDPTNDTIAVTGNVNKFSVNDYVLLSGLETYAGPATPPAGITQNTIYKVASVNLSSETITLKTVNDVAVDITATTLVSGVTAACSGATGSSITATVANANLIPGDVVSFAVTAGTTGSLPTGLSESATYVVKSAAASTLRVYKSDGSTLVDTLSGGADYFVTNLSVNSEARNTFTITNLTKGKPSTFVDQGNDKKRLNIIGLYGLQVPAADQIDSEGFVSDYTMPIQTRYEDIAETTFDIAETDDGIVLDSDVGRTFLNLGLATEEYVDIDFDGDSDRVYKLTTDGEAVAKIYLYVDYFFAGEMYSFSGTILPYVVNDQNLDIKEAANSVKNGWEFMVNENSSLQDAVESATFDLSQSIVGGAVESTVTQVAYNSNDPAIHNDAIWTYLPNNNNTSSTLSNAWLLFLNKDSANADMLISAGTAISNLFVKGMEVINYSVMDQMLTICEKRKDMFAIFDGVDEPKIKNALQKMVGVGSQGDIARWGGIFDGRSIFFDSVYTKLNVEAVKSIEVAAIIALNRASNVYWLPPAGYTTGRIPAALSTRQKYVRTYNYADDPNSDIAKLYDANINPTRVNDQGQFIYGQKTMLKRMTALNRLNVIMLITGIHKRFANFLDTKVFQLNTSSLRANIQAELQAQLELIKAANPAGLTEGLVICDETNNTPTIIDTNQLIVDVVLQPTRTAEFITLRTTVQRTGDSLNITNVTVIGG